MGLFDSIKSVFGGGATTTSGSRETDRIYIVDAEKLADSREGRTGPVERFRAIQQLSRFADREKVEITAVVGGRPLREVAHGELFNGVRVFYVEENSSVADQIEKTIGTVHGRKPVVITNDKQLDARLLERGIATLRVSTLRKAFEGGSGDSNNDGGRGRDRDRRGDRRRGPRPDRQQRPQQSEQDSAPEADDSSAPESSTADQPGDTVDGLIDRVS